MVLVYQGVVLEDETDSSTLEVEAESGEEL